MKRILLVLNLLIFASIADAKSEWYTDFSFAYGFTKTTKTDTLQLLTTPLPGVTNLYVYNSKATDVNSYRIGVGKKFGTSHPMISFKVGVDAQYTLIPEIQGVETPLVNIGSNFDPLLFSFKASNFMVSSSIEVIRALNSRISLYAKGSVGPSVNRFYGYYESVPSGSTTRPANAFGNESILTCAFSLATGIQYQLTGDRFLSFGYQYLNTGNGELGYAAVQNTQQRFKSRVLESHFLTLTFSV